MKKILPFLFLCIAAHSSAQTCSLTIAPTPGHIQITNNQTLSASATVYWVCSGISVTIASSPGATYLLEQNAVLTVNSTSGDAVFAKPGSMVINNSTGAISVTSNTSNVTRTNNSTGFILDVFCSTVTLNYSQVGIGPCSSVTGIFNDHLNLFTISPNPVAVGNKLKIIGDYVNSLQVLLFDLNGKIILEESGDIRTISTQDLLPGVYILQLNGSGYSQRAKIMIE